MRVIYHNWSVTKQRPHPQSVAEISHHSVLSGDRIRQCDTSVIANREMNTLLEYGPHLHLPFYFPQRWIACSNASHSTGRPTAVIMMVGPIYRCRPMQTDIRPAVHGADIPLPNPRYRLHPCNVSDMTACDSSSSVTLISTLLLTYISSAPL